MNKAETPEWLEENGDSSRGNGSGITDPPSDGFDAEKNEEPKGSRFACCSFGCIFLGLISLVLCGLFVYSAVVQDNDADGLQWIMYYSFNALVPVVFLIYYYTSCFPVMAIHLLSALTAIWSIVYIVIASLKVQDTPSGGATDGTGDNDNQTLQEEYIFELAGASIGLLSSLYHPIVAKCCVMKDDKKVEEDNLEEKNLSEQV